MACAAVHTGTQFLATTLAHLDCQGRTIGAYGYGALADPGSSVSLALTGILTVFIALFGIRLLLGARVTPHGLIDDVIKVGLFLALATSWPAWRTLAYDLVLDGPAQLAAPIGRAAGLPGSAGDLFARLQDTDDGIVSLTMYGSGRLTGGVSAGADLGDVTTGIALADQTALGSGRTTFLATVIGTQGLLTIGAGLLLSLAPLMAGLLLFAPTRALFTGWLRGLVFCALASLMFRVIAGVEMALLYPWLTDALAQREANVLTPSAPTELFVLALAFAVTTAASLFLLARVTFLPSLARRVQHSEARPWAPMMLTPPSPAQGAIAFQESPERSVQLASAVAASVRREDGSEARRTSVTTTSATLQSSSGTAAGASAGQDQAGTSAGTPRRAGLRPTRTGQRRDRA